MKLGLATLLLLTAVALRAAPGPLQSRLTVVPPGPVTTCVAVELRLGLAGLDPGEAAQVSFYWDSPGVVNLIERRVLRGTGAPQLAQAWARTSGRAGKHRLLVIVEKSGTEQSRAEWPLEVAASPTSALPLLQAGWLDLLGLLQSVYPRNREATAQDLREIVDAMHRIGMDTAIITYVEYQGHFFYPSALSFADRDMGTQTEGQWLDYDAVETILSQADCNGMHVFLGLGRGGDTGLMIDGLADSARLQADIRTSQSVAAELWQRYGQHPSFYGWYSTHEMNGLAASSAFYDPVADFCHGLCPEKPFMVAPDGSPLTDPETLRHSHVDIFCYQDAVGTGYVPGQYTWDPERRMAQLTSVYTDYQHRHQSARKHLWADLELWEMAGPTYANPYPANWSRVRRQLIAEASLVEMITGYEFLGFMQAPESSLQLKDDRARQLYRAYETWYQSAKARARH